MVNFILIKSPDEWESTKQACRDELVVYLFFSPIHIHMHIHIHTPTPTPTPVHIHTHIHIHRFVELDYLVEDIY